jgi:prevent-host-death family protein
MARKYSVAEARAQLSAIVDQAEKGQTIELTRRGKPVAVVVSLAEFERLTGNRPRFSETYRAFLSKFPLVEAGVEEGFAASRRDRAPGREVDI